MKIFRLSQTNNMDFGGYFSGQVPDYAPELLGTPSVEASQISSAFGRTNEALQLVNQFSGNILNNIAFIFNFSKGGAYGVYVPALDNAIKTKALKNILESKGYKIVDEGGMLKAYSQKEEKKSEDVENEIKQEWSKLSNQGGTAIGMNVSDILNASTQNASKVVNDLRSSGHEVPNEVQTILQNILAIYNLASTIVHEASHSRGGDEGAAESDESAFGNWSQNKKNEQYKKELEAAGLGEYFSPLQQTAEKIHANSKNWYKTAQYFNYAPGTIFGKPQGSDLEGRFNQGTQGEGRADWSMLVQKDHHMSIEKSLNKNTMFPIDQSIDQEHNILEEQLRKNTMLDGSPDARLIMEELLTSFHDETASYQATETLLEDNRPKPLMRPIKKASLLKTATLFGWYNNLDLSEGSTISEMSDRVMAWEDRDECFSQEEDWIDSQPRYNPEYDLKGFYYRWIEPRFKPQLWNDMTNEDTANVHPAKRFGQNNNSKKENFDPELVKIINILGTIQRGISEKAMKATRLIVSEDIAPLIEKFFSGKDGIETKKFQIGKTNKNELIIAVWVFSHGVSEKNIRYAEHYFENKNLSKEVKEVSEQLLGTNTRRSKAIDEIVNASKQICQEYEIKNLFIIGSYAREKAMGENPDVSELDFRSDACPENIKIGTLLAKKLGVAKTKTYENSMAFSFMYKGIRINFEGDIDISEISKQTDNANKIDFDDDVISDLCNRDFTINMLAYNVLSDKVEDKLGIMEDLKNKTIKTYFNPEVVLQKNPMLILRALKLKLKYGFNIDEKLKIAMIKNSLALFNGKYSEGKLNFARESVREENREEADRLFDEFNLSKIKGDKNASTN